MHANLGLISKPFPAKLLFLYFQREVDSTEYFEAHNFEAFLN